MRGGRRRRSTGTATDHAPAISGRELEPSASIISVRRLVFHYHWLLCAEFCAYTDWAEFVTLLDSRAKDSAELLILLPNPKYSLVGSIKSRAVPFGWIIHPRQSRCWYDCLRSYRQVCRRVEIRCAEERKNRSPRYLRETRPRALYPPE